LQTEFFAPFAPNKCTIKLVILRYLALVIA